MDAPKVLLIRFSSFGDVTQCLSVPSRLKDLAPNTEVHWVIRQDLATLLENHPSIDRVWTLNRETGFRGLWELAKTLRNENFTHVYDAHNNLRSHVLSLLIWPPKLLRKSQKRWWRFFLFRFRWNFFEKPFSGQRDLLEPLTRWGLSKKLPPVPQIFPSATAIATAKELLADFRKKPFVVVAASAAFPLKRWPLVHWRELLLNDKRNFVLLGGPEDIFLHELSQIAPDRIKNLAGLTSLNESTAVISLSQAVVANDTGLLHVAEQLGKPTVALMGPAPFGFPSRPSTQILEIDLYCRPCSKHGQGPCINPQFQKCLADIRPITVSESLRKLAPVV